MKRTVRVVALLLSLTALLAAQASGAVQPRTSLTAIEPDVMCPSCQEPLAVAESPQAYAERNFIRTLVARGMTKAQIEQALVAQYGPAVLGRPPAHGFNLTIYILPPAIVLAGAAILALTLPRWRRRARATASGGSESPPALRTADAKRLDEDLARHP